MARSKRKHHIFSWTVAGFNRGIKKDKIRNNHLLRRHSKQILKACEDYENLILPEKLEEVMNRWDYLDDGRWKSSLKEIYADFDNPWRYIYK